MRVCVCVCMSAQQNEQELDLADVWNFDPRFFLDFRLAIMAAKMTETGSRNVSFLADPEGAPQN